MPCLHHPRDPLIRVNVLLMDSLVESPEASSNLNQATGVKGDLKITVLPFCTSLRRGLEGFVRFLLEIPLEFKLTIMSA